MRLKNLTEEEYFNLVENYMLQRQNEYKIKDFGAFCQIQGCGKCFIMLGCPYHLYPNKYVEYQIICDYIEKRYNEYKAKTLVKKLVHK